MSSHLYLESPLADSAQFIGYEATGLQERLEKTHPGNHITVRGLRPHIAAKTGPGISMVWLEPQATQRIAEGLPACISRADVEPIGEKVRQLERAEVVCMREN